MIEFYSQLKALHIYTVLLSGGVFAFRGLLMLGKTGLSNYAPLKYFSYINDSILLLAGVLLMLMTHQYPITHHWLSVKLSLVVVYILIGILALRTGSSYWRRAGFFLLAVFIYLFIISIARSHHPLGLLFSQ